MKKILMIALSLIMILGVAAASGENAEITTLKVNEAFEIRSKLPEGYSYQTLKEEDLYIIGMLTGDVGRPMITISISYNEEYDDVERFNDVDEATVEEIKYSFLDMDEGVVFEDLETAYGTRLLKATAPEKHFIDIYTIYKSYELEFVLTPGADPLSDADVQMLVDFISDMEFVPAA